MTIDEAIEHAEWCAENSCGECAEEHAQFADWLRELRRARMEIDLLKTLRDGFKADAQAYKSENDRLAEGYGSMSREHSQTLAELSDAYDRVDELRDENAKLRSERDYWRVEQVHAYSNWEDTHKYAAKLKAENDKLRELAREMYEDAIMEYPNHFDKTYLSRFVELGIEV